MAETPLFLSGAPRLFAVLHRPDAPVSGSGFVLCAPFAEEKKGAHRLLVDLARELCQRGVPTLRFDYRGTGDSEGSFLDFTLAGAVADILRAADFLRRETGVERVGLVGVRLGAALAALAAREAGPALSALALWEPISNGRRYVQMNLRQKKIREMMTAAEAEKAGKGVEGASPTTPALQHSNAPILPYSHTPTLPSEGYDFDGYWVTSTLHAEMEALLFPKPADGPAPARALLLSVNAAGRVSPEFEALRAAYAEAGTIAEARAVTAEPFWSLQDPVPVPELIRVTADWATEKGGA